MISKIPSYNKDMISLLKSHAVGMAVARPMSFEIDFVRNSISRSAAWFFVDNLKFIFTAIFEIKVYVKNLIGTK